MIKLLKIIAIGTPIIVAGGSSGIYLAVASHNDKIDKPTAHSDNNTKVETGTPARKTSEPQYKSQILFPILEQHNFYKYIKMNGPMAVIDDNMQNQLINYILKNANISGGSIRYKVVPHEKDKGKVDMYFSWYGPDRHTYQKVYKFSLSGLPHNS